MATVLDVAQYILEKEGAMTTMKLQKLCYYSQAWHLVWETRPLFNDRIEAWANGPVAPNLYHRHSGMFTIATIAGGNSAELMAVEKESIDVVLEHYGSKQAFELSDLTHRESPWKDARGQAPTGGRSNAEITPAAMYEYYDGLVGVE